MDFFQGMLYNLQKKKIKKIQKGTSYNFFKPFSFSVATLYE